MSGCDAGDEQYGPGWGCKVSDDLVWMSGLAGGGGKGRSYGGCVVEGGGIMGKDVLSEDGKESVRGDVP